MSFFIANTSKDTLSTTSYLSINKKIKNVVFIKYEFKDIKDIKDHEGEIIKKKKQEQGSDKDINI